MSLLAPYAGFGPVIWSSDGVLGSALNVASSRNHLKLVEVLIERGVDINASWGHYGTSILAAAQCGHIQIVERLLAAGADPNKCSYPRYKPLNKALNHGGLESVDMLLDHGVDVDARFGGESTLYLAAQQTDIEVVKLLLDHGAPLCADKHPRGQLAACCEEKTLQ